MTMSESEMKISGVCDDIKELLIHKIENMVILL